MQLVVNSVEKPNMSDLNQFLGRVNERLKLLGMSAHAASCAAGKPEAIRNLQRTAKKGGRLNITTPTLEALARVLKTSEQWLLTGERSPDDKATEQTKPDSAAPEQQPSSSKVLPVEIIEPALTVFFAHFLLSLGQSRSAAEAAAPSAASRLLEVLLNLPTPPIGMTVEQMALVESSRLFQQFENQSDLKVIK